MAVLPILFAEAPFKHCFFERNTTAEPDAAHSNEQPQSKKTVDGPFHRRESPTQTAKDAANHEASQEIWGKLRQNSNIPQVQAYTGALPPNTRGVEFWTTISPMSNSAPGQARWVEGMPGVRGENGYAKISVRVVLNTRLRFVMESVRYRQINTEFLPQDLGRDLAMLHLEPEQISKRAGIQFQETYDDLDYLQLAVICTASNKKFALTRHLHAPVQGVVIHSSSDSKTLAEDLKDILRALEVKSSEVSWVNPDVPISLTKTSKTKSGFFLD